MSLLHVNFVLSLSGILDSFPSSSFIRLTFVSMLEEVVADDADDWLCLACLPNIVTKHPQNFVEDSSSGRTAMHCRPLQHNTDPTTYVHIGPSVVGWPLS